MWKMVVLYHFHLLGENDELGNDESGLDVKAI